MAKHNVYINLPKRELNKVDAIFEIFTDNSRSGTLTISKGAIEWYPANAKKPYKMGWKKFDNVVKHYFEK